MAVDPTLETAALPAALAPKELQPPNPPPLEPTLSKLIVVRYEGARDDGDRYDTSADPAQPGTAEFIGGHTYTGLFSGGMMNGTGKYEWADGTAFEGEFKWNVVDGKGKFVWPDGSTYDGEVRRGMRHGTGTFKGPGGAPSYSGEWHEGQRHGKGTLWYDLEKDCYYEGGWLANSRHGEGSMRYKPKPQAVTSLTAGKPRKKNTGNKPMEGNLYVGSWAKDQKNGYGTMEWYDKREKYKGEWVDDKQNGRGEHVWMDDRPESASLGTQKQMCNRYVGGWRGGVRHGVGTFFYANGARYHGEWSDNAKQGYGVFTFEDGHVYEGPFENDRMTEEDAESPFRADETMQPQLRLKIADLLPSVEAQAQKEALEKTVLRYTSELKAIYKRYSTMENVPGAPKPNSGIFALTMGQFKKLWADCALGSYGVSITYVHRLVFAMRTQHESEVAAATFARKRSTTTNVVTSSTPDRTETYDSETVLLFREFVELLSRVAVAAFGDAVPKLSPAEAFKQLMAQAISSNHSKTVVKDGFEDMLVRDETKRVLSLHENVCGGSSSSSSSSSSLHFFFVRLHKLTQPIIFRVLYSCYHAAATRSLRWPGLEGRPPHAKDLPETALGGGSCDGAVGRGSRAHTRGGSQGKPSRRKPTYQEATNKTIIDPTNHRNQPHRNREHACYFSPSSYLNFHSSLSCVQDLSRRQRRESARVRPNTPGEPSRLDRVSGGPGSYCSSDQAWRHPRPGNGRERNGRGSRWRGRGGGGGRRGRRG